MLRTTGFITSKWHLELALEVQSLALKNLICAVVETRCKGVTLGLYRALMKRIPSFYGRSFDRGACEVAELQEHNHESFMERFVFGPDAQRNNKSL